jgi:tRNA pseudouridine55 synthase
MTDALDGVILADKPAGRTSHDVVAAIRREVGRGLRVGHAGTLDPFATGLLLVLVGRATRAQRFFMALAKTYRVVARFGAVSSTGDPEGSIVQTGVIPAEPLELPTGEVRQRPPAHSAVKVGGERAYRRARRGEAVDTPERVVCVHRFEQLWREGDRAAFEIECSSGTYVRSLIADLGDAYCESLRRTAIGPFDVERADGRTLIGLDEALAFLPERRLGPAEARAASHGRPVPGHAAGPARLVDAGGLIAIAEPQPPSGGGAGGELKPVVGFRG